MSNQSALGSVMLGVGKVSKLGLTGSVKEWGINKNVFPFLKVIFSFTLK